MARFDDDRSGSEAALLVMVPCADPVVGQYRATYDSAAQVGVPAHMTIAYPFKPNLGGDDVERLTSVFAGEPGFNLVLSSTGWFGEQVLFLRPDDPGPVIRLACLVSLEYPQWPLYGDSFDTYVPHMTIGLDQPVDTLKTVEAEVCQQLPITQPVTEVQYWSGPALSCGAPGWRMVRAFNLASSPR